VHQRELKREAALLGFLCRCQAFPNPLQVILQVSALDGLIFLVNFFRRFQAQLLILLTREKIESWSNRIARSARAARCYTEGRRQ